MAEFVPDPVYKVQTELKKEKKSEWFNSNLAIGILVVFLVVSFLGMTNGIISSGYDENVHKYFGTYKLNDDKIDFFIALSEDPAHSIFKVGNNTYSRVAAYSMDPNNKGTVENIKVGIYEDELVWEEPGLGSYSIGKFTKATDGSIRMESDESYYLNDKRFQNSDNKRISVQVSKQNIIKYNNSVDLYFGRYNMKMVTGDVISLIIKEDSEHITSFIDGDLFSGVYVVKQIIKPDGNIRATIIHDAWMLGNKILIVDSSKHINALCSTALYKVNEDDKKEVPSKVRSLEVEDGTFPGVYLHTDDVISVIENRVGYQR
jgi:hypothetical protein